MLWYPNDVAESILNAAEVRRESDAIKAFTRELRSIDTRLDLILMGEDIPDYDMLGGFYYIKRANDDGTTSFWQVQNPDGSYREPDSAVLEAMRRIDSNADNVLARQRRAKAIEKRKNKARQAEKRREFSERLAERLKFNHDTPSRPKKDWGTRKDAA